MLNLERRSSLAGFTLKELIIVIAIIGVATGLLIPFTTDNRERGRRSVCADNMRQIHYCLTMYEQSEGMFPTHSAKDRYGGDAQEALNLLYRQYTEDVRIFLCPSKPLDDGVMQTVWDSRSPNWPNQRDSSFKQEPPGVRGQSTSYGYSPGHNSSSPRVVILADRRGTGPEGNSDNHGSGAGQNVLLAGGGIRLLSGKRKR